MQTIKQPAGSVLCLACVAAMATDTTLEDFLAWAGRCDGPFSDPEFWGYLFHHGYQGALGISWNAGQVIDPAKHELAITFRLEGQPAYIAVERPYPDLLTHAIYWDGERVHDPCPTMNGAALESYKVREVYPVTRCRLEGARFDVRPVLLPA